MLRILSFDCAIRNLGVCYVTIDTKIAESIAAGAAPDTWIVPHFMRVIDVAGPPRGAKHGGAQWAVGFVESLCGVLRGFAADFAAHGAPEMVLIEYQMSANDKSRCVMNMLIMYYAANGIPVRIVGPSLKNKITFGPGLEHGTFTAKYATAYAANKAHTKANFARWVAIFGHQAMIADIPKAHMADIADAFMQILGWLRWAA